MLRVVNDGAQAYRGVIPADQWREPYMPEEELRRKMAAGVRMWGCLVEGELVAVMGTQEVEDVMLIRHAYVASAHQRRGLGSRLLRFLLDRTARPVLVGTWSDAAWAVRFYERHSFRQVAPAVKGRLLGRYWSLSPAHAAASVVLADARAWERFVMQ